MVRRPNTNGADGEHQIVPTTGSETKKYSNDMNSSFLACI